MRSHVPVTRLFFFFFTRRISFVLFAGEGGEGEEPPAGYQEDDGGCPEDDEDEEEEEEEGVSGGSSGSPPRSPIPSSTDGVEHNDQTVNERLPLRSVSIASCGRYGFSSLSFHSSPFLILLRTSRFDCVLFFPRQRAFFQSTNVFFFFNYTRRSNGAFSFAAFFYVPFTFFTVFFYITRNRETCNFVRTRRVCGSFFFTDHRPISELQAGRIRGFSFLEIKFKTKFTRI